MSFYKSLEDEALLQLIIKEDEAAYAEIYHRYHDLLYAYVYNKLLDKDEAQDVVHDIIIKVWTKREQMVNVRSVKAYLFTCGRNKAFDIFAHKKMTTQYLSTLDDALKNYSTPTDYLIREKDLDAYIKKQVGNLAPKMREVFELSRYNHFSNSEIATMLGISKNTVETQIKRALKALRYKLTTLLSIVLLFF